MNESSLDREPIELVEIVLPKCINTYGVSPCTATGGTGQECYNCRATCQDPDNYRDTPDRHLDPDLLLTYGAEILESDLSRVSDLFASFEVRFTSNSEGIIWEQGSSSNGVFLGVDSGNLIFEVTSTGTGTISVPASQFSGMSVVIHVEILFVSSGTTTLRMWVFDPVEFSLTLLGSESFTAGTSWADTDSGSLGLRGGSSVGSGRPDVDWNGGMSDVRFFDSTPAPSNMSDGFRKSLWLGKGAKGEPTEEVKILPCLLDTGTMGSRINLNAADDNYDPLGRRATLDFSCSDFNHSDVGEDPYFSTRLYDPRSLGTFWPKWLARQKFGKVGALVRKYDGYSGQMLKDYKRRSYVLDRAKYNTDEIGFYCRDVITRTEFRRAQIPPPSSGILELDVLATDTTFTLIGDVTSEYPESGTIRINDEIMTYSSRSAAGAPVVTTFSGITRGTDGSSADDHEAGDLVQICRRYTDANLTDVQIEWLVDDSRIPAQFIDIDGIEEEDQSYLNAYSVTTLITEPIGVSELLGRLSEECSFYLWWDERDQKIRKKAIRATGVNEVYDLWTYEKNIVAGSFNIMEQPKQRLNVITVYYNPIDFAGDLNKPTNFKNGERVINGTTSLPEQYGNLVQSRTIYSIFLTTAAQVNQTASRLSVRYADIPVFADFYVDAKDRDAWVGDIVQISHPTMIFSNGDRDIRRWLIVEAEEVDPGNLVRYVCADITLDGTIFLITENGIGTYTADLFAEGNAFITDNDGLNPDGTTGATIS